MTEGLKARNYWPGLLLFCATLVVGLLHYKDYGISWDEPAQRGLGRLTYAYVVHGDNTLKTYDDRRLGSGFELPLIAFEKKAHLTNERDIYLSRHIITHIFFLIGVLCGYVLALRLFNSQFMACLAFVMLAFEPRIYAHSFFNTKDVPFLAAFLMVMLAVQVSFDKDKPIWYLFAGLICGYATSIRAMGILFVLIVLSFFLADVFIRAIRKQRVWPVIFNAFWFMIGFCALLYLAWPLLWGSPVSTFIESFQSLSGIVWTGKVLFRGSFYAGNMLPLDYMPVWFAITVPELWLTTGLAGFVWVIVAFVKTPAVFLANSPQRNFLLYVGTFALPIIAMWLFHGVNIDDWRHIYFIYPPFVMLALFTINKFATARMKVVVRSACMLQIVLIAFFMIRNHPFQQVYFNNLVSHKKEYLRKNYDLEYWGCAYKNGLEYILAHDTSSVIRLWVLNDPSLNAIRFLPESSKKRVVGVFETEHPDYFITNFREHPQDYKYPNVFYNITVMNSTIMRVYKLKK